MRRNFVASPVRKLTDVITMVISSDRTTNDRASRALIRLNNELKRENTKLKNLLSAEKNVNKLLRRKNTLNMKAVRQQQDSEKMKNLNELRHNLEQKLSAEKETSLRHMNLTISRLKLQHKQEMEKMKKKLMIAQNRLFRSDPHSRRDSIPHSMSFRKRKCDPQIVMTSNMDEAKKIKLERSDRRGKRKRKNLDLETRSSQKKNDSNCLRKTKDPETAVCDVLLEEVHKRPHECHLNEQTGVNQNGIEDQIVPNLVPPYTSHDPFKSEPPSNDGYCSSTDDEDSSVDELYEGIFDVDVDENRIKTAWLRSRKYALSASALTTIEEGDEDLSCDRVSEERLREAVRALEEVTGENRFLQEELVRCRYSMLELQEQFQTRDFEISEEWISMLPTSESVMTQTEENEDFFHSKFTFELADHVNVGVQTDPEEIRPVKLVMIDQMKSYQEKAVCCPETKRNNFELEESGKNWRFNILKSLLGALLDSATYQGYVKLNKRNLNVTIQCLLAKHFHIPHVRVSNSIPLLSNKLSPCHNFHKLTVESGNLFSSKETDVTETLCTSIDLHNSLLEFHPLITEIPNPYEMPFERFSLGQTVKMPMDNRIIKRVAPPETDHLQEINRQSEENIFHIADLLQERVDDLEAQKDALKLVNLTLEDERCKLQLSENSARMEMLRLQQMLNNSINAQKTLNEQLISEDEFKNLLKQDLKRQQTLYEVLEVQNEKTSKLYRQLLDDKEEWTRSQISSNEKLNTMTELLPIAAVLGFFHAFSYAPLKYFELAGFESDSNAPISKTTDFASQTDPEAYNPLTAAVEKRLIQLLDVKFGLNTCDIDNTIFNMDDVIQCNTKELEDDLMMRSHHSEASASDPDSGHHDDMNASFSSDSNSVHSSFNVKSSSPRPVSDDRHHICDDLDILKRHWQEEKDILKHHLSSKDKQLKDLELSTHGYLDKIEELEYELKKLENQRNDLLQVKSKMLNEYEGQKEKMRDDFEDQYEELLLERNKLKSRACDLEDENFGLRQELECVLSTLYSEILGGDTGDEVEPFKLSDSVSHSEKVAECTFQILARMKDLRKSDVFLRQKVSEHETKESAYHATIEEADIIMCRIQSHYKSYTAELERSLLDMEKQNEQIRENEQRLKERIEDLSRSGHLETDLARKLRSAEAQVGILEEQVRKLQARESEMSEELICRNNIIHNLKDELIIQDDTLLRMRYLQSDLKSHIERLEALQQHNLELENDARCMRNQIEDQEEIIRTLKKTISCDNRDQESFTAEYRSEIRRLRKQLTETNAQLAELDNANKELESSLKLKQDQISDLKSHYESRNREAEAIKASQQLVGKDSDIDKASGDHNNSEPVKEPIDLPTPVEVKEPTVIVRSLTNLKETEPGGQKEPVKVINNEIPLQDTKIHQELNKLREKIEDLANKLKVSEKEGELLESNLELKEKELQEALEETARVKNLLEYFQFRNAKNLAEIEGMKGVHDKELSELKQEFRAKDVLINVLIGRILQVSDTIFIENIVNDVSAVCEPYDDTTPSFNVTQVLTVLANHKRSPSSPSSLDEHLFEGDSFHVPQPLPVPKVNNKTSKLNYSNSFVANSTKSPNQALVRISSNPLNESIRRIPRPLNNTTIDLRNSKPENKNRPSPTSNYALAAPKEFQMLRTVADSSILLSWVRGDDDRITGYRIVVDDDKIQSVRSSSRNKALVPSLNLDRKIKFSLYAVGGNNTRSPEVTTYYEPKI